MKILRQRFWGVAQGCSIFFVLITSPASAEKVWTNSLSGFWRDGTNWTGHAPPDITSFIQITNDLNKIVTIDSLTPATELTVQMLTLNAPPGATNTLLLSNLTTNNPLIFQTGLEMEDGAALVISNSALAVQLTNDHVNLDGSLTLDGGSIDFGDMSVTTRVGRATSGVLTINSGVMSAGTMTVGGLTNSTGTVNVNGGTLAVMGLLSVGRNQSTVGTFFLLGGQLNVLNDDTRVGESGLGYMTISNATAVVTNLQVGHDPLSAGTLTLGSGALVQALSDVSIARFGGSTGLVSVVGGQLQANGNSIFVGRGGAGELDLTSGNIQAPALLVAADTTNSVGATGMLAITGGNLIASSTVWIGSASYSTGQVLMSGGWLIVTNGGTNALLGIPSGSLVMNAGMITADRLLLTNKAGQFAFNGGALDTKSTTVANGAPFVVGDGVTPATLHLSGGTHSFANGLVISSNATLNGCGTIIGSIINNGTIATNCGSTATPPIITQEPLSQTVVQGGNVTLGVVASGTQPLSYQWQFDGTNLSAATTSSYTKHNVQPSDAGGYAVVVSNVAGSVTSAVAVLTVTVPPSIITPPQSQTVVAGGGVTFTVVASGTQPLSYQWQFDGTNLAGASASSYSKSNLQLSDAGSYTVVVTNLAGSIISPPASLAVLAGLTISLMDRSGPTNTISFRSVTGSSYTLQFKNSLGDATWTDILPATTGTGNTTFLLDRTAIGPQRFYRVRVN